MTSYEFSRALRVIRWTPGKAAERLNRATSTIRKMATEHAKIPEEIAVWLRAFAAEIAAVQERYPPPRCEGRPGP